MNNDKCWDCGSTISNHHTPTCELAAPGAVRDLPAVPGTQWWTEAGIAFFGSVERAEQELAKLREAYRQGGTFEQVAHVVGKWVDLEK